MEILIISFDSDPPYMGGVCTVTHILAEELTKRRITCWLGYIYDSDKPSQYFQNKIKISHDNISKIKELSTQIKFDVILTQFLFVDYSLLQLLKKPQGVIISVYHSKPEIRYLHANHYWKVLVQRNINLKKKTYCIIHLLFFYLFKTIELKKDRKMFQIAYNKSDKLVLLSQQFYPLLRKIVPKANISKLAAIGNPIVFNDNYSISDIPKKKKQVLIVCNYNHVKRIPIMFKIWKSIEQDKSFNEWELIFVGGGEGFHKVIKLSTKMGIQRIHYAGYTSPIPFYRNASIFLMTSKYEGYPMVLLEALQMGVVPIVYNSFESLTDIITHNFNGIIVPNNNISNFTQNLKELIKNDKKRHQLAQNAIISSEKHSKDQFIKQYLSLFYQTIQKHV